MPKRWYTGSLVTCVGISLSGEYKVCFSAWGRGGSLEIGPKKLTFGAGVADSKPEKKRRTTKLVGKGLKMLIFSPSFSRRGKEEEEQVLATELLFPFCKKKIKPNFSPPFSLSQKQK